MVPRCLKLLAIAVLTVILCCSPVYAQKKKKEAPKQEDQGRAPVVEYMVAVVLLAIPIGLICRSSRR